MENTWAGGTAVELVAEQKHSGLTPQSQDSNDNIPRSLPYLRKILMWVELYVSWCSLTLLSGCLFHLPLLSEDYTFSLLKEGRERVKRVLAGGCSSVQLTHVTFSTFLSTRLFSICDKSFRGSCDIERLSQMILMEKLGDFRRKWKT